MGKWLTCTLGAVLAAGCSYLPPVENHPDDPAPARLLPLWQIQLDTHPPIAFFPVEHAIPGYANSGKIVIAGSDRGELVAADAREGRELWRFRTQGKIRGGVAVEGRQLYFGATDGKLYKLDAKNGDLLWDAPFATRGAITSAPVLAGERVYFRTNENRVYALNAATGAWAWDKSRRRSDDLTVTGEGTPCVVGDRVFVGFDDGHLVSLRVQDGETEWAKNLSGTETRFTDVDSSPVHRDGLVYAASFASGLYAVDAEFGGIKWRFPDSSASEGERRGMQTPAVDDRYLYTANIEGHLWALDPVNGKVAWSLVVPWASFSAPVVEGAHLFIATGKGVMMVDAATGTVETRILSDDGQNAPVAARGGYLHYVTNAGALVGLRLQ